MKRFAKSDYGNEEGREPVITQKCGGDMLLGPPIAGAVVGGRVYSRGQAIRLLGGGLAVAACFPTGWRARPSRLPSHPHTRQQ